MTFILLAAVNVIAQSDCLLHSAKEFNPFVKVTQADYGVDLRDPGLLVDGVIDGNDAGWGDGTLNQEGMDLSVDPAWIMLDLFTDYEISSLELFYNKDTPGEFYVELSDVDGNPVRTVENLVLEGGKDQMTVDLETPVNARYVKLNFTKAGQPQWGIQFKEICLHGTLADTTGRLEAIKPTDDMVNIIYTDGPWKSEISFIYPQEGTKEPWWMIDNNVETDGGWNNGMLGDSKTIAKGDAWFTLDLKRSCNVSALKFVSELAAIQGCVIELFADNPDVDNSASLLHTAYFNSDNTGNKVHESIYLEDVVKGVRYIKFNITKIANTIWGGRIREIAVYGPDNAAPEVDRIILSDNKGVVGRTSYIKVQAVTEDGTVVFDNLDATFTLPDNKGITIGDKTADGYPVFGVSESVVGIGYSADIQGVGVKTGEADIIVASPLDQHTCLISHTTNRLSVAHQSNPVIGSFEAENALNGVDNSSYFLAGWDASSITTAADGSLDPHANWWTVDLGRDSNIEAIRIFWSENYARRYKVELFNASTDLWNDFRDKPADADALAIYTHVYEYTGPAGGHTDIVRFDKVVTGARRVRVTMLEASGDNGVQFHEVCLLGRDNPDYEINSLALVRKDVHVGETRSYSIYGMTNSGYTIGSLEGAVLAIDSEKEADYVGRATVADGKITGDKKGLTPVILTWNGITTNSFLEVTTSDWSETVNIAREFRTTAPSTISKNGFTLGNPKSKVISSGIKGAENETAKGVIDGDWMSWTITAEEMRAQEKPYVTIDLGNVFPLNEFNIHWNASGDGEGNGSYIMLSGNYVVYGSTDNVSWTQLYTVANRPQKTYDVDRHVFPTGDYRYMKFEFTSPKTYGQDVAINEITIGGPQFNVDGQLTAYPESRVIRIVTPTFDHSNQADRAVDNDWIVTSTKVNGMNPLILSYLAVDCYGNQFVEEGQDVNLNIVGADGETVRALDHEAGKTMFYRNIHWPVYDYAPETIGKETVRAVLMTDGGEVVSDDFTIYTVSDRGNVNRYAYAYDNAVNCSDNWESETKPGTGDRDLSYLGTAPQNASDGSYGSWYVIGYYGDGDNMGQTYKYPANTVLERPYELVMDYRGENYAEENASRFVKELDMIGIQWEGAFARDYNVYILHCDENGAVTKNADGSDAWEEVASFVGLQSMGVGQVETQRIYPADENGLPLLDADGKIIPWQNVAAVKIEMLATGTQWGIKMMESAIYGQLNKTVLQLDMAQAVYADKAATEKGNAYYSFDLALATDFDETDYVDAELAALGEALPAVDSYKVEIVKQKIENGEFVNVPFSADVCPTGAVVGGNDVEGTVVDGKYLFDVKVAAEAEGYDRLLGDVLIKNVDPSMDYRARAKAFDAAGNAVASIEINNSDLEQLVVPTSAFTASDLVVNKVDDVTITNCDELITGKGQAAALGSTAGAHKSLFHKANKVSLSGAYGFLRVTDDVVRTWDITYVTELSVNGIPAVYTSKFSKESGANSLKTVSVDYIPVVTEEVTAAAVAEELADAPDDIRSITLTMIAPEGKINVSAINKVVFELGEKNASAEVESEAMELSQASIAGRFVKPGVTVVADGRYVSDDCDRWDAFLSHSLTFEGNALHNYVGYYVTNAVHASLADDHAHEGFFKGGYPEEVVIDRPLRVPGNYGEADNYGWQAAVSGSLGLHVNHVSDQPATYNGELDPLYSLITNEYPLLLAPVEDGVVSSVAVPQMVVADAVTTVNAAVAAAEGQPNLQTVTVPSAVRTELVVSTSTGIENVGADNSGEPVYYNLQGIRVDNPQKGNVYIEVIGNESTKKVF